MVVESREGEKEKEKKWKEKCQSNQYGCYGCCCCEVCRAPFERVGTVPRFLLYLGEPFLSVWCKLSLLLPSSRTTSPNPAPRTLELTPRTPVGIESGIESGICFPPSRGLSLSFAAEGRKEISKRKRDDRETHKGSTKLGKTIISIFRIVFFVFQKRYFPFSLSLSSLSSLLFSSLLFSLFFFFFLLFSLKVTCN